MTDKEYNEIIEALNKCGERAKNDPEYAKMMLAKTGIYNPDGSLHKNYGGK